MKKNIAYIILLISLLANTAISFAQETRVTGTLKVHPWLNLPVVISTDLQGGLQSLGTLNLTATPITVLNATVPTYKRTIGMISTVIDADSNNKTRYFEYSGADQWREIYVIYGWEAGRAYAIGDYVAYDGNFYVANAVHTSSATFIPDALKWNNAGGKDGKYTITEIKMDGQILNKVAISTSTVLDANKDNTIATAGYILNAPFNGNRPVTRTGLTGISDVNFGTTTIAGFLNSVFFPSQSPLISYFQYMDNRTSGQYSSQAAGAAGVLSSTVGTITLGYLEYGGLTNLVFKYELTPRDGVITKVELFDGLTSLGTPVVDGLSTGTFTFPKTNPAKLTLKVTYNQSITDPTSLTSSLDLNTAFTAGLKVLTSTTKISATANGSELASAETAAGTLADPYLILRTSTSGTVDNHLTWTLTPRDDAGFVTNIDFVGNTGNPPLTPVVGTNLVNTDYTPVQFSNVIVSDALNPVYRYGVRAKGSKVNEYSDYSYSKYYQLRDKFYCGFLNSNVQPTEAQILAGAQPAGGVLKTTPYYVTAAPTDASQGVELVNSTSRYLFVAVPTYVKATDPQPADLTTLLYYYATVGGWNQAGYVPGNTGEAWHYFVQTSTPASPTATWYWVCIFNVSQAGNIRFVLRK